MTRSSSAWVAAALVVLLCAGPASAQPSTADAARALYAEGKELRRVGELRGSLEKLEAAHALYATPITALEVGRGHALVGHYRRAIEVLASVERIPVKSSESSKAGASRIEARALLEQYQTRLARLLIRLDGEGDGARLRVDGELLPSGAPASGWLVDPGAHHVEAERGEQRVSDDVRAGEGETVAVTLRFKPAPPGDGVAPPGKLDKPDAPPSLPPATPAPTVPPPAVAAPPPGPAKVERSTSPLVYVGFAVSAAGVVTGTVTGIVTLSRAPTLKQECRSGACPSGAGLGAAQALGNVSTASFVLGGAGLALGVAAFFVGREHAAEPKRAWLRPWIGAASAGVLGVF